MISQCLSLLLWWSSISFTGVGFPELSQDLDLAVVSNLSCSEVHIGGVNGTFNSSLWLLETTTPSTANCTVNAEVLGSNFTILADALLPPSRVALQKSVDGACYSTEVAVGPCDVSVTLEKLELSEPNFLLDGVLSGYKDTVATQASKMICEKVPSYVASELMNRTLNPPAPHPTLLAGAAPLERLKLFRALASIARNAPPLFGVRFAVSSLDGTTLHVHMAFPGSPHLRLGFSPELERILGKLDVALRVMELASAADSLKQLLPMLKKGLVVLDVPHSFNASFEVVFHDLRCAEDGINCTVPRAGGIALQNIRSENLGEWDKVITNIAGPFVSSLLTKALDEYLQSDNTTGPRFLVPTLPEEAVNQLPPMPYAAVAVVVAVLLLVGTAVLSVWRHRRGEPVTTDDGLPLTLKRALLEDLFLMLLVVLTAIGFTWCLLTTIVSVVAGGEVHYMSFALLDTIWKTYDAGLRALAVLMFTFSAVYPYLKLVATVVCTLILQRPEMLLLRIINYLGKFALLDVYSFIALSMTLQIDGLIEVKYHSGFYVFVSTTLISIVVGNYATHFWRRGTSLYRCDKLLEQSAPYEAEPAHDEGGVCSLEGCKHNAWTRRRLVAAVASGIFVAACVLPAWILPSIGYKIHWVIPIFKEEVRRLSLFSLATLNWSFFVVCFLTVGLVPLVHTIMFPQWMLLASWCAIDVLLVACVAGFAQLESNVAPTARNKLSAFVSTTPYLYWPLILLLICTVWLWLLAAENTFQLSRRLRAWMARRKARHSS
ncbi:uncharacterized protein Tco025E_08868 [Trypanosoma conorhini]|uniref:Paraquat-inducible protein A n=1 Tax=Trypanosoma conorhini TaxID=83891 RepID=A0A422N3Z4_9TRYP|nr:uncharacterized protein Tco025E_08868 [Trypanosoma conorhini]RNF00188.1 hypothetical protein Tco025E_08868 [Trypanosoma conorhini]